MYNLNELSSVHVQQCILSSKNINQRDINISIVNESLRLWDITIYILLLFYVVLSATTKYSFNNIKPCCHINILIHNT